MNYCKVMDELTKEYTSMSFMYINYRNTSFMIQPCSDIVCCDVSSDDIYSIPT
jgi:hypothetical protein